MKCTFCGKEIKDGSVFCKFCGSKIEPVIENPVLPVTDIQDETPLLCDEKVETCAFKKMNDIQCREDHTAEKTDPVVSCEKEKQGKNPLSVREKKIITAFSGVVVCLSIIIISLLVGQNDTQTSATYNGEQVEAKGTWEVPEIQLPDNQNHIASAKSDFIYVSNGSEIQINGYQGNGGHVRIPDEIDGVPVTRISKGAFKSNESITGLALSQNLQVIGDDAFAFLSNLTGVLVIPKSVTSIGHAAFQGTSITGVVFTSNCSIGVISFNYIDELEFIYIPEGCNISIDTAAFTQSPNLKTAVFPNSQSSITDGVFEGNNNLVIYAPEGSFAQKYGQNNFIQVNSSDYDRINNDFYEAYFGSATDNVTTLPPEVEMTTQNTTEPSSSSGKNSGSGGTRRWTGSGSFYKPGN